MAARAIWKGVITFSGLRVPVKLYSAVADRDVHFRLLHRKDKAPVRQALVNPDSGDTVDYKESRRAWRSDRGDWVLLTQKELDQVKPEKSRDIEITRFLHPSVIDHRWYDRAYYLGVDGADEAYAALTAALERSNREGLAQWVMRDKAYLGALRLHQGVAMLITLRHAGEVVPMDALEPPGGDTLDKRELDKRELDMARQLIDMLAADFEPEEYRDEYRHQVLELIERKRRGERPKVARLKRREPSDDVSKALQASLDKERRRA